MNPKAAERFWAKVDLSAPGGCWVWTAGKTSRGYGSFKLAARQVPAHRVAYESLVGPVPPGRELDHLCRVRACVNPAHMEPVTHRENVLRGAGLAALHATKTKCPEGHPYDEANTYVNPNGGRECRSCRRDTDRRRRARQRATQYLLD